MVGAFIKTLIHKFQTFYSANFTLHTSTLTTIKNRLTIYPYHFNRKMNYCCNELRSTNR